MKIRFFRTRSLITYYALFISGAAVLVYQALGLNFVGDSVNFLCLLFLVFGMTMRRWIHIFENSALLTLGYILPLLLRNSFKLSYQEAFSVKNFLHLAMVSSSTTLAIGVGCSAFSFLLYRMGRQVNSLSRSQITVRHVDKE